MIYLGRGSLFHCLSGCPRIHLQCNNILRRLLGEGWSFRLRIHASTSEHRKDIVDVTYCHSYANQSQIDITNFIIWQAILRLNGALWFSVLLVGILQYTISLPRKWTISVFFLSQEIQVEQNKTVLKERNVIFSSQKDNNYSKWTLVLIKTGYRSKFADGLEETAQIHQAEKCRIPRRNDAIPVIKIKKPTNLTCSGP